MNLLGVAPYKKYFISLLPSSLVWQVSEENVCCSLLMTLIILESVLRQLYQDISEHSREVSREVDQSDHLNGNIAAGLGWTQPHTTESNKLAKESILSGI